jgi:hypothetical protein
MRETHSIVSTLRMHMDHGVRARGCLLSRIVGRDYVSRGI